MGIFDWLGGGKAVAEGAAGIATAGVNLAQGIRSVVTGKASPETVAELERQARELEQASMQMQADVNAAEARSPSVFVAGARPFILWVCGFAVAYKFVVRPIISIWAIAPDVDAAALWPLLTGILGLGGMRSWEKAKGVNGRHG